MWQSKHIAQKTSQQKELFADLPPETPPPEKPKARPTQQPADNPAKGSANPKNGYYYNGRFIRNPYTD
ncbi:MAG: hypothetical protein LBD62_02285 [Candidatus Margulisbacteria bacterium]|jgi:hypothetical protein|nr:hypothetical protein [Candidatus Margulisiibacteriota bacterium]